MGTRMSTCELIVIHPYCPDKGWHDSRATQPKLGGSLRGAQKSPVKSQEGWVNLGQGLPVPNYP